MRKIAWTILILVLLLAPTGVVAEDKLSAAIGTVANSVAGIAPANTSDKPAEIGISASEVLPGTGSRAGYVLGHNNVIPGSEWVFIGAKHGKKNVDYTMDYASGTLYFTEPVRTMDSVRVDYRYSKSASSARSITGPGVMPLAFGDALKLNLTYSYRTSAVSNGLSGPDILTYGFNTTTKFGSSSSISGMAFVSSPQASNRLSLTNGTPNQKNKAQPQAKKDHMIMQNADLGMGKFRLKLGMQDVGENFSGFQSMRDSNAGPADVINQLEKEKGLKRMDIAGQMPVGLDNGVFNFMMGRISDKNDDIYNRMFGFSNNSFAFNYSSREVGKNFSRFKDLKEADRGQYAAEAGMTHNEISMQFKTGLTADKKPVWSGMNITELKDPSGGTLVDRSISVDVGKVQVDADIRTSSMGFSRMGALTDDKKKELALLARRTFNPKAQVSEVTARDTAQVNYEAGLNRTTAVIDFPIGGPVAGFMSFSGIDSANGGLNRSALGFKGKWFQMDFDHRSIDPTFKRLVNLQPIEQASYGNEYGMTRTTFSGAFNIAGNETNIKHTNVVDEKGSSLSRQSVYLKNKLITFSANFQDIAPDFNRILDLSDTDRLLMVQDKGFKRADYAVNLRPMKGLTIDSYMFNSDNVTAGQTRGQSRHKISYKNPKGGPAVNLFQDSYNYVSEQGVIANYFHREFKFDNKFNLLGGLQFNSRSDFNVNQEGADQPVVSTVTETHIESKQDLKTSFKADTLNVDYGNGKFSDTKSVSVKTQAINRLALIGTYGLTARDAGKSGADGGFGVEWTIRKGDENTGLKLNMSMANRDGGPNGSQQAQKFGLSGLLAKRFLIFDNIKVGSAVNTNTLKGRQTACDNAIRLQAGVLGGSMLFDNSDKLNIKNGMYYTSRLMQYDTDKSDKKWYHFSYMKQDLVAPSGKPAEKRNMAFDVKISNASSIKLNSYYGKDDKNGEVIPVGGTTIKFNHTLKNGIALTADYTTDVNDLTNRMARIVGFGFSGKLKTGAEYQFYYGLSRLMESGQINHENIFRMSYNHTLSTDHFITFTAEKKSAVDKTSINPFEGNMVARIDFRTTFK